MYAFQDWFLLMLFCGYIKKKSTEKNHILADWKIEYYIANNKKETKTKSFEKIR